MYYNVFTGKTCFPLPVTLVGTFSSIGISITTTVSTTLAYGDYLYSSTKNEIRQITGINSDKSYTIASSFTSDVTNDNVQISDKSITYIKASIAVINTVDGLFNGAIFPKRTVIDIDGDIHFTVDGTSTAVSILAE